MNTEDILKDLWSNYNLYFWSNDNLSFQQIRMGTNSEANLIFSYNSENDRYIIERTVYRDLHDLITLSHREFSNEMIEYRIIKDLIILILSKLTDREFNERQIILYSKLIYNSNRWINLNFDN
ncbi:hypothetical protein [Flavobacterium hydatis]|uniref:Uncharacterized protein n=1 Tax=Flavobacterium hydatis TaxID=991 RepID=A0A086AKS3_FLAHY|nr:hypothetical protein [Flavobacterium hydatis]KFF17287.1 hypothetical protein IW20_08055 [Flavobacterium hydatis]OXA95123.1 hypothetical protein B0A62_09470 [Flavobacterium hydatis]